MEIERLQLGFLYNHITIESESFAIILEDGRLLPIESNNNIKLDWHTLSGYIFFHLDKNNLVDFILFEDDILVIDRFYEKSNIDYTLSYNRDYYNMPLYDRYRITIPQHLLDKSNSFIMNHCDWRFYLWYKNSDERLFFFEPDGKWEKTMMKCFYDKTIYPYDLQYSSYIPSFEQELIKIDSYLDNLDVDGIIDSFTIENVEFCQSRIGRDDYYYITKTYKKIDDEYINALFPHKDIDIYSDHGYVSAYSMRIDFEKRPYLDEERALKLSAKEKYDKNAHRRFLIMKYYEKRFSLSMDLITNTRYASQKYGELFLDWIFQSIDEKPIYEICQKSNSITTILRALMKDRQNVLDDHSYWWDSLFSKETIRGFSSEIGDNYCLQDISDRVTVVAVSIPKSDEYITTDDENYYCPIIYLTCYSFNGKRYALTINLRYKNYDDLVELQQLQPGLCHMHIEGIEEEQNGHSYRRRWLLFTQKYSWGKIKKYETSADWIWVTQILEI